MIVNMKNAENQMTEPVGEKKASRLKVAIVILGVLVGLSAAGLAARYIYLWLNTTTQTSVTVPGNLIGEDTGSAAEEEAGPATEAGEAGPTEEDAAPVDEEQSASAGTEEADKPRAAVISLYEGKAGDNERFEVSGMLPGDTETKYYCVKVNHEEDIALYFRTDITEQSKELGEVLHIKVTHLETGKVLCDAPYAEVAGKAFTEILGGNAQGETTAYYRIDVSLATTVGNEYQGARLKADFAWYVEDEGALTPPTGERVNVVLWIVLAASMLVLLILLVAGRKGEKRHG